MTFYIVSYIYDLYRSFLATYGLRCLKKMILHSSLENHSPLLRLQPCRRTRHHTSVKELNKHRPDTKVARPSSDRVLVVQDRTNTTRLQTHITELNYIESIQMFFHWMNITEFKLLESRKMISQWINIIKLYGNHKNALSKNDHNQFLDAYE